MKFNVDVYARTLVRCTVEVEAENEEEAAENALEQVKDDMGAADFDVFDGTFEIEPDDIDEDLTAIVED